MNKQEVVRKMCESGFLPVFRTDNVKNLMPASQAFYDAGVGCVEYTMTMPNALELIAEARASLPKDLCLGLGTVMDGATVDAAADAGASFIASPSLCEEVIKACNRRGVASVVGAMTPTEVMNAVRLGADVIKVFPAVSVGPKFFAEIAGPFPGLHTMAAGGITPENMKDYIQAGAEIVTRLGNGMNAAAYASGDFAAITQTARDWLEGIRNARKGQ
jgi:2-dehydro-3-deoxyphosphogluconate aldolase/(4S)-4-hydroxy-2-oxoglutarate aldolase